MDPLSLIVGILFGAGAAATVAIWLGRTAREAAILAARQAAERDLAVAQEQVRAADGERRRLTAECERLSTLLDGERRRAEALGRDLARTTSDLANERQAGEDRATEQHQARILLKSEFENLANRLLEEKGKALASQQQVQLDAVLGPLRERLKGFEETVTKTYDAENRDRASLLDLLKRLGDSQVKLGKEAESLSRALSGESKVQGDWGEMILENLLQSVGLEAGREYQIQESHTSDGGSRLRPDVVIYLPDNKAVVVDSKVSINAFIDYTRAEADEARSLALAAHGASVRNHIKDLAGKRYQDVLQARSLDFVVLFVPSEAAFHAAIGPNPGLYNEAYAKGIILASPTTLLATLKVVAHVWQAEKQNLNAQRIAEEAGKLLDKFVGFAKEFHQVGERLKQAQEAFDGAKGKLETGRGNLVGKAKTLSRLGAKRGKADKELDLLPGGEDDGDTEEPGLR